MGYPSVFSCSFLCGGWLLVRFMCKNKAVINVLDVAGWEGRGPIRGRMAVVVRYGKILFVSSFRMRDHL